MVNTDTLEVDFSKPVEQEDGFPMLPLVEFTEDEWATVHTGTCIESTYLSYRVRSRDYGTLWVPKEHVRLPLNKQ